MPNFKSIQLVGFKSFADKTTIPLSDGVTCIVGPNGCGKSNVADAVRWVLGEQSAKMMRGSQMLDVIFNGTETRRKTSFCEVTLTFDNTNRIFDIDSDEVEMTRRLYRDGESEYVLNRQPSRMKVLTALLHGAGAAKEGYSIIGQGRIAQIMNSKPEDRRSIFEEATGIVVFKDRKADAERKLSASKDNLRVFQSRLDEVERQIGPLGRAAENAKKYRDLYSQLRHHEINAYIYRTESAEGERAKINAAIDKLQTRKDELATKLDDLLKQHGELRGLVEAADSRLKVLNDKRLEYSVGVERSNSQSRLFKEKANAVRDKLNSARDQITASSAQITSIEAQIRREEHYSERNNSRLQTIETSCEALKGELAELSKKLADYEFATGEHRKKVMETFKDLSELKQNMGSLSAQKQLLEERMGEMSADMDRIRADKDRAKAEYDASLAKQGELAHLLDNESELMERATAKLKECDDKLQQLIKQVYDTEAQVRSLNSTLETYRSLRERFEGYGYAVKRLMTAAKDNSSVNSKIEGLIADVVSCPKEYETAIETAFGGAMQNVITATRDDARSLIEFLKLNRLGQVTFLPIDALRPRYESDQIRLAAKERGAVGFAIDLVNFNKKYENVIHNLLGNTLICDDIVSATNIAKRFPRAFKIVTLDGDIISNSGSMTGGSRRENAANLLANERKIKELEDDIAQRKNFLSRADSRREALEQAQSQASAELDGLRLKLNNARVELTSVNEKQAALMREVASRESEYSAYAQSISELRKRLGELDSRYSDADAGASRLNEQSDKASAAIDDMSGEYEKLAAERDEKTERVNGYNVEIATLKGAIKTSSDNVARLTDERENLLKKVAALETSLPDLNREFESFTEQATRAALSTEEQNVLDGLVKEIEEVESTKRSLSDKQQNIDKERLEAYDEQDKLSNSLNERQRALQKIDDDLEHLKQRIEEEYNETYESCLSDKEEGYDISTSASSIANFKRQITMLGSVNLNAIEEYEELSARYNKMLEERADLTKAIDDLSAALSDICTEMLKIFNEGFVQINENFKRTFKELFGGGKAELQLDYTNCDDPLSAGVEIVACPPGKKLTKISLLSGGEQALTAIAILFAIIQMRPMPFCILDEIEAALDDANVGRYAKFLKKFASTTQFIVITHRKPTMEVADTLFGVTMEEKGVSKIVSVKLSEVEERLGGDTVE